MTTVPTLLKKLADLHRQRSTVEYQIVEIEREIVAAMPKPRAKPPTGSDTIEAIKPLVKVLQEAGGPLKRREIAARLQVALHIVAYRLKKAVAARFVEKTSAGRYRVVATMPEVQ